MQSTGEVACFGSSFSDALVKALLATGVKLVRSRGTAFVSVGGPELKAKLLPIALRLKAMGMRLAATEDTGAFLVENGLHGVQTLYKVSESQRHPNVLETLDSGGVDIILNVPSSLTQEKLERMLGDEYVLRRRAVELGVPLFTSMETFAAYVEGLAWLREHPLSVEALYGSKEPATLPPAVRPRAVVPRAPRRRRR